MSRQERTKWKDPRIPASVERIGKFTVTIYDQAAYDVSLEQYPDDNKKPQIAKRNSNAMPRFKKSKPSARYKWTKKLKTPLSLTLHNTTEGESA
jgi:hypothetical protein